MRQGRYRHQPKCAHTAGLLHRKQWLLSSRSILLTRQHLLRAFADHSKCLPQALGCPLTCRRCGSPSGAVMRQALVTDSHPVEQKLHRTGWEEEESETNRDTSFLENALQYNQLCEIGLQGQRGHGGKRRLAGQVWDWDVMMMGGKDGWSRIQFLWHVISLHVCYRTLLLPKAPGT